MKFPSLFVDADLRRGLRFLRKNDAVMAELIRLHGPCRIRKRQRFVLLAQSIISQQISSKAAQSIRNRVNAAMPHGRMTAKHVVATSVKTLRSCGLSERKAEYLRGLASAIEDGTLRLNRLPHLDDEDMIAELVQLRGIGRWTAQMYLMFGLGRMDVLPCDDVGVLAAMQNLYDLDQRPDKSGCVQVAEPWRPYATLGSWYCWRSFETPEESGW